MAVDTKKKELIGEYQNGGREYRIKGDPELVKVHDCGTKRINPDGGYDSANNTGGVKVGTDNDTAEFAVESIRRWWNLMGKEYYPAATQLLITADGGGSNGSRVKLWKIELQKLATETGLNIHICHLPPGTSKFNKIEHRLFSLISMNWRGKPLVSEEVAVNLIASTKTRKGLEVKCGLDTNTYEKGLKIDDELMETINIKRDNFHGDWNYVILPKSNS